jgi:flagellar biosynthesis regulator FlaF
MARMTLRGKSTYPEQESALSSTTLAQTAYAATAPVRTSRGTEYAAFQKVTAHMVRATRDGASMTERAAALHENRRLWTVLATDLADDANAPSRYPARSADVSGRIHALER